LLKYGIDMDFVVEDGDPACQKFEIKE